MAGLRDVLATNWRAVPVLGITQILAWGTLFYPPVLTVPLIAAERGWSATFAMSGLSAGLLAGGLVAPMVGAMIDRFGGHVVMTAGSLVGAAGLVAIVHAAHPAAYFATWIVLGAAMAASLYDSAFATLGRIFGAAARRPITLLTFAGGFASTVSWPATQFLIGSSGWRGTYLVYAGLLAFIAAPLHAFALPRQRTEIETHIEAQQTAAPPVLPPRGAPMILIAAALAAYAFVPSGLSAHLLAIFGRAGIDAATVVLIGALFGPAQVTARLAEFAFASHAHPLNIARAALTLMLVAFLLLALAGISAPSAALFAVMFGVANGLITIARGTVPLALFGAAGYGRLMGRIAGPSMVMQAAAPLVLAFVAEHGSDAAALAVTAAFAVVALLGLAIVHRPSVKSVTMR